jgi:hypothetical protein
MYLSEQNIVHADIAARNILITSSTEKNVKYTAKIGKREFQKLRVYTI